MAYLSTDARAASHGEYGQGGCGYTETRWHNMPDATVGLLPPADSRGDIEISWSLRPSFEGVLADLTVSEARTLRDNLTRAINDFDGIDNAVEDTTTANGDGVVSKPEQFVFCGVCHGRIWAVSSTFDQWWVHEAEPDYGHDAVPAEPESEAEVA
ncbi:hypothetical protein HLB23_39460 [Nocardia uniformis]|uniref:Uncharacterized protein n=1 Tax=Nocardia uniformis TaxID=53432 RepID=A0A849CD44_9NOCA|nr:hypothetical protein [Nocardia uniformis]NNH75866.1 hypothetical protein [Nocardia uniformis]